MAKIQLGTADGSAIGNPPAGSYFYFNDSNNGNLFTRRSSAGVDDVYATAGSGDGYAVIRHTVGTTFTFTGSFNTVIVDTATVVTVNLKASPNINDWFIVKIIQDASVNNVTIDGNGENIDGETTFLITSPVKPSYLFVYDGTEFIAT